MSDTITEIELKFVKEDDEVLHSPAQPWSSDLGIDPENLVKEMLSIMLVNNGIGLAAPQVGLPISVFVMGNADSSYACFNPRVISVSSERTQTQEGCLSYPGLYLNIKRPTSVVAEYEDVKGETHRKEFTGILATVFLHEFDHLHGICFVDRASDLSVKLAKQRVRKNLKKQGIK
jgi:peptide deformylase